MRAFDALQTSVEIPVDEIRLHGTLDLPSQAEGLVIFAHGSGSSRHSPRNQRVAASLRAAGFGTLLVDLLSPEEEPETAFNARLRADIRLLAGRLRSVTRWARVQPESAELLHGYFGANNGGAAALLAAVSAGPPVGAIVTRGARLEFPPKTLQRLRSPTLLIAGGNDAPVLATNLETWARLPSAKSLEIIPGAGHLFEEPGALDIVAALAARWFGEHLRKDAEF